MNRALTARFGCILRKKYKRLQRMLIVSNPPAQQSDRGNLLCRQQNPVHDTQNQIPHIQFIY